MKSELVRYAAEFFKISEDEAIARVDLSTQALADEWETKESIEDFYTNTENYVFDLIKYNTDDRVNTTIYPIVRYSGIKILDFGGGIGEISRRLTGDNKVFYYDLPSITQEFAKYVCDRENKNIVFLTEEQYTKEKFNVIIAVDVFEHLEDSIGKLKELTSKIEPKGYLLTTGLDFTVDPTHPQHLRINILKRKEFLDYLVTNFFMMFYNVSPFGTLYLWRKK